MKSWILPALAVGTVIFLMTRPGRDLQEEISDNFSDWVDNVLHASLRLQQTLRQAQTVLERCNRSLQQAAD